jgi:hypothetical protein
MAILLFGRPLPKERDGGDEGPKIQATTFWQKIYKTVKTWSNGRVMNIVNSDPAMVALGA